MYIWTRERGDRRKRDRGGRGPKRGRGRNRREGREEEGRRRGRVNIIISPHRTDPRLYYQSAWTDTKLYCQSEKNYS